MRTILHPVLLLAAGYGLSALAASPALAKTCPSGQFLQVSKGKCISKDSARDLGIAGKSAQAAKAKPAKAEAKREKTGESTVARSAPSEPASKAASERETTLASAAPAMASQSLGYAAQQAEPLTVRRNIAPFGALQFGGFK